ncbi:MAG TPA: hypothetical protein VLK25_01505, partial [Allosphingosinicella sp.]|nr:hypothetical protein [Allosphingosinicella sp.]
RYDRRGERDGADRQCSREQIGRADVAMRAYRHDQGYDRPDWGTIPPWNGPRQPRLWISPRDGHGSVYFDRGCTVRYARDGRREGADRGCSRRQIDWADDAMRIYRRQQGVR